MSRLLLLACLLTAPTLNAQITGTYIPTEDVAGSTITGFSYAQDAAVAPDGSIGIAGVYRGELRRDAVSAQPPFASTDRTVGAYFARYTAAGTFAVGDGTDLGVSGEGQGVTFDAQGNMYSAGWITPGSNQTFDGANGTSATLSASGVEGGYVVSYTAANEVRYVTRMVRNSGATGGARAYDVAVSANGQGWVGGRSSQQGRITGYLAPFNVATGARSQAGNGSLIETVLTSTGAVSVEAIDVDAVGNAFFAGWFTGTLTVQGKSVTSAGGADMFAGYIGSGGSVQWVSRIGGAGDDLGYAIALDPGDGNVGSATLHVGGYINGAATISHDSNPNYSQTLTGSNTGDTGVVFSYDAAKGQPFTGSSWSFNSPTAASRVWELKHDGDRLGIGGDFSGPNLTMANAYSGAPVTNAILAHTSDATGTDGFVYFTEVLSGTVQNAYSIANSTDDDRVMGIGIAGGSCRSRAHGRAHQRSYPPLRPVRHAASEH